MNVEEALAWLSASLAFGIRPGLERIEQLLQGLGHPERKLQVLHLAGTNGKGSISAYAAHMLAMSGHRVGWFTSPYLVRFTERIRILDGPGDVRRLAEDEAFGEISPEAVAAGLTQIRAIEERRMQEGGESSTEFERITALALLHFAASEVEYVVLETGLGGRLDSTNVFERPLAVILAALGYDHQDRLGNTMAEISKEKCGIIKPGVPVFAYRPEDMRLSAEDAATVRRVIEQSAAERDAPLRFVGEQDLTRLALSWSGQRFRTAEGETLATSQLARYQPIHALLAYYATYPQTTADGRRIGTLATHWPARLEVVNHEPFVLLDGAHNDQGVVLLRESLDDLLGTDPLYVLLGVLADKSTKTMVEAFFREPIRPLAGIVCTAPPSDRALPAAELWREVAEATGGRYNESMYVEDDPVLAAQLALNLARRHGRRLLVFGSLYLAGAVRRTLMQRHGGNG